MPRLVNRLEAERDRFDAVLFFTYLYFPTYWGLRAAPERSILVPTAHDEPALRLMGADPVRISWARPWRRRFRLVGDPLLGDVVREHLSV